MVGGEGEHGRGEPWAGCVADLPLWSILGGVVCMMMVCLSVCLSLCLLSRFVLPRCSVVQHGKMEEGVVVEIGERT